MASAKLTLGSIFGTINDTANAVSSLVNTTTRGIGMLDAFVTKAANEQRKQHIADDAKFEETLLREFAQEQAEADLKVVEFCKKSADHERLYQKSYDRLNSLLNPEKSEAA